MPDGPERHTEDLYRTLSEDGTMVASLHVVEDRVYGADDRGCRDSSYRRTPISVELRVEKAGGGGRRTVADVTGLGIESLHYYQRAAGYFIVGWTDDYPEYAILRPDGSLQRLPRNLAFCTPQTDDRPVPSPDGGVIAWIGRCFDSFDVVLFDAAGRHLASVKQGFPMQSLPPFAHVVWAPDSQSFRFWVHDVATFSVDRAGTMVTEAAQPRCLEATASGSADFGGGPEHFRACQ